MHGPGELAERVQLGRARAGEQPVPGARADGGDAGQRRLRGRGSRPPAARPAQSPSRSRTASSPPGSIVRTRKIAFGGERGQHRLRLGRRQRARDRREPCDHSVTGYPPLSAWHQAVTGAKVSPRVSAGAGGAGGPARSVTPVRTAVSGHAAIAPQAGCRRVVRLSAHEHRAARGQAGQPASAPTTATPSSTSTPGWPTRTTRTPSPTWRPRTPTPRRPPPASAPLREQIFAEIKARTQESDLSVPVRKGGWWQYARTVEGQQYAVHCRRAVRPGEVDPARWPRTASRWTARRCCSTATNWPPGHGFFALGAYQPSPDWRWLAYSTDFTGDERFTIRVKDLATGALLPDEIPGTYDGCAWSLDGSALFYVTVDDAWRPYRVWRHRVGTPAAEDVMVFEEADERFHVDVGRTRSERYVMIRSASVLTSEVLAARRGRAGRRVHRGGAAPPRRGLRRRDAGDRLLILHNDGAENFELATAPLADPATWTPLVPHRADTRLLGMAAFARFIVVYFRRDGLTGLRILRGRPGGRRATSRVRRAGLPGRAGAEPRVRRQPVPAVLHLAGHARLGLRLRHGHRRADPAQAPAGAALAGRRALPAARTTSSTGSGRSPPTAPGSRSRWSAARARRGTAARRACCTATAATRSPATRASPSRSCRCSTAASSTRIAHIRGGGEMGRAWYNDGKLLRKKNTFTDFIACAEHLAAVGLDVGGPAGGPGRLGGRPADGRGGQPGPAGLRRDRGPGAVRRRAEHDPGPVAAADRDRVGGVGRPAARPGGLRVHEVVHAVRERHRAGLPADLRAGRPERHPGDLPRAGQVDRPAAGHRPAAARSCSRPRWRRATAAAAAVTTPGWRRPWCWPGSSRRGRQRPAKAQSGYCLEQGADRLAVVDAADRLGQGRGDRQHGQLGVLGRDRRGVGADHLGHLGGAASPARCRRTGRACRPPRPNARPARAAGRAARTRWCRGRSRRR